MNSSPRYIVAVSGGVDSVVLLHMLLHKAPQLPELFRQDAEYVVAHVEHGIRGEESVRDMHFVESLASKWQCTVETTQLHLGVDASEDTARKARYDFLVGVMRKYEANAILTAHHLDDVIETAIINIMRGTGRSGLSSLASTHYIKRPLLELYKEDILNYAREHQLEWVEDSTNGDSRYKRNEIRKLLREAAGKEWKSEFAKLLHRIKTENEKLDKEIANVLQYKLRTPGTVSRNWFVKLPHDVACEVMRGILVRQKAEDIDQQLIERLVIALKAAKIGSKHDVDGSQYAIMTKRSMRFINRKTGKTYIV